MQEEHVKKWILAIVSVCASLQLNAQNENFINGLALLEQKKYEEAVDSFNAALEECPGNPFFWERRGYALFCKKNHYQAINSYTIAIVLAPKNASYYIQRALAYHETGNSNAMINDLTTAARIGDLSAREFLNNYNISWEFPGN